MALRSRVRFFPGIVALSAGILLAGLLPAADTPGGDKVYERTLKSTTWVISVSEDDRVVSGSGSLIDATRKLILTNYHVVGDREETYVLFPVYQKGNVVAERSFYLNLIKAKQGISPAKVLVRDSKRDLALIQLPREVALPPGAQALKLAHDSVKPGQRIHSIGNPGTSGALWVYTPGEVRQVYRKQFKTMDRPDGSGFNIDARVVETSSAVNRGDSGGPVVNDRGELVAVTQGHQSDTQARLVSYFIDVSEVKELLQKNKLGNLIPKAGTPVADRPATPAKETTPPATTPPISDAEKAEKTAAAKIKLAKTLAKEGKTERAKERYEEVVEQFPNTKAGKEAKELLEKLRK